LHDQLVSMLGIPIALTICGIHGKPECKMGTKNTIRCRKIDKKEKKNRG